MEQMQNFFFYHVQVVGQKKIKGTLMVISLSIAPTDPICDWIRLMKLLISRK
jgi:hypothetical protein